jgi:type I restriction enzyme M protein
MKQEPVKRSFKAVREKKAVTPEDIVCDLLPVSIVIDEYFGELMKE